LQCFYLLVSLLDILHHVGVCDVLRPVGELHVLTDSPMKKPIVKVVKLYLAIGFD
jgi:hypothetical protein